MRFKMPVFIIVILLAALALPTVYAADIALSSTCGLADAIIAANHDRAEGGCRAGHGADAIALTRDIALDGGLPKITSDITIDGNGYTISGGSRYRIFYNDGGALTIHDLTLTKGRAEGDELITNADGTLKATTANPIGGAILNWSGTVTISDSAFISNSAGLAGGAIHNWEELSISNSSFSGNSAGLGGGVTRAFEAGFLSVTGSGNSVDDWGGDGGAISNWSGTVTITNSAFSDNSAEWGGGAIFNWEYGELSISDSAFIGNSAKQGGAITNQGELSISDSSFSDNSAEWGGAITNQGELSISSSTFSGNSAERGGGAIVNWSGTVTISDSTFSDNSAKQGGAITNRGYGELSIISSTFSDNSAERGGAIGNWGELSMVNSIIAGRGGDACYSESLLKQNIRNFIQDGSCDATLRGAPMLGELVIPEDGSPPYFPLLAGSRAIDAADDAHCPETDQLGRPRPQGAGCDIGAVEYVAQG